MSDNQLLEVQNLHTGFRLKDDYYDAVDDVSFTLDKNEILAIVGESGCGKSTLATTIMGLLDPNNTKITGEILYNDLNLIELNETLYNKIRGNDIGMIFQDPVVCIKSSHENRRPDQRRTFLSHKDECRTASSSRTGITRTSRDS